MRELQGFKTTLEIERKLGVTPDTKVYSFYWQSIGDELMCARIIERGTSAMVLESDVDFTAMFDLEEMNEVSLFSLANIGSSDYPHTHRIVVDRTRAKAYVISEQEWQDYIREEVFARK